MGGEERGRCTAEKCHSFIRFTQERRLCMCMCPHTFMCGCVHVGVCLKPYFHIGLLPSLISHLSITFSKCYAQNAKLQQGQKDTDTRTAKKKKIPPFVSLTIQV